MAILSRTVAFTALVTLASAFQDTVPVVAWASQSSRKLDSLATLVSPFGESSQFFDALLDRDLCQFDAVVVAEQPGLHASDLQALPQSSYISSRLTRAAFSLQLPYLPYVEGDAIDHFKRNITEQCGARRFELGLGQGGVNLENGVKHVVCVSMPHLKGENQERKATMRAQESQLSKDIAHVASTFPSHIVIYLGSSPFTKRQATITHIDPDSLTGPVIKTGSRQTGTFAPINTMLADGGLFQRYQFFTPGLITALLITFFLLVPVVLIGVYALASIQSPLRMDPPKGPSLEKKTQ